MPRSSQSAPQVPAKKSKRRRCLRCKGRPFLTECAHSARGKRAAEEAATGSNLPAGTHLQAQVEVATGFSMQVFNQRLSPVVEVRPGGIGAITLDGLPEVYGPMHAYGPTEGSAGTQFHFPPQGSSNNDAFRNAVANVELAGSPGTLSGGAFAPAPAFSGGTPFLTTPQTATEPPVAASTLPPSSSESAPGQALTAAVSTNDSAVLESAGEPGFFPETASAPTANPQELESDDDESDGEPAQGEDQGPSTSNGHGFVEGAMKGNFPYSIRRTKALRKPAATSSIASRRFRRVMKTIVRLGEGVSGETGCWLYIAGQHTTATTPFIHYVSPRLREEALPEVRVLHTNFSRTFSGLINSRRREAAELAMELDDAKEKLDQSQKLAKEKEEKIHKQNALIAQQQALITQLQEQAMCYEGAALHSNSLNQYL
ncbi:hypothetical protein NP233_g9985 [Leucocoprinus birnbaumii]|uniref:Uncharacterized protein n=1 Tax=Leucocoprinus birnbaumii TaxID=56174 RepID=A0AAD5YLR4_9AGAR|nr:hypothetical protein NP233_g9985 [Leucocoprinus birnbaumii]